MNRKNHAALFLRMLAEKELRLGPRAHRLFASQANFAAKAYESGSESDAIQVVNLYEHEWVKTLTAHYYITAKDFSKYTKEQIGAEGQKALNYQEIIFQFIAKESLRKAKSINGTTIDLVRDVIRSGVQEGLGSRQIGSNIRKKIGKDFAPYRSFRIAKTETHNAASFSGQATAESSGIILDKEWVTSIDGRERREHKNADRQRVALKERFTVAGENIMRPGEGAARNVINCRCSVIYHPRKY